LALGGGVEEVEEEARRRPEAATVRSVAFHMSVFDVVLMSSLFGGEHDIILSRPTEIEEYRFDGPQRHP
jgi:hypothetical protein